MSQKVAWDIWETWNLSYMVNEESNQLWITIIKKLSVLLIIIDIIIIIIIQLKVI